MKKFAFLTLMFFALVLCAAPIMAQDKAPVPLISFDRYIGAAITTLGAAFGIGKLASSALESMARQPEVAGNIQTAMIIAAALIEGFTFFALVICFMK
ncbi:ATP synthase F0 subunit C [Anatilimnocola floriformis]|uniref:ATP synthase F0 subunit C n=1 Tax=Anatilimnocola floriformis TaxID=2948575 RepID=UPI0020C44F5C|nr:ATP synthase F0 subunit C [Anatilimnocola floriformis]